MKLSLSLSLLARGFFENNNIFFLFVRIVQITQNNEAGGIVIILYIDVKTHHPSSCPPLAQKNFFSFSLSLIKNVIKTIK